MSTWEANGASSSSVPQSGTSMISPPVRTRSSSSRPEVDRRAGAGRKRQFSALVLGATGVVFGDIGTSPLYTYSGIFGELHADPEPDDFLGAFSMIFWTLTWTVCIKYVGAAMRVNHHGEGGVFALMEVILETEEPKKVQKVLPQARPPPAHNNSEAESQEDSASDSDSEASEPARCWGRQSPGKAASSRANLVTLLGMLGCSMLIGDGVITPTISVLSALELLPPGMLNQTLEVVLGVAILFVLFAVQRFGSQVIGIVAGPIMVCWFLALGMLGLYNISQHPQASCKVAAGFNPVVILRFWTQGRFCGFQAWRSLAGVVLCVTGAEALYADLGHFGAGPISLAWFALVYPCLVLQYLGQSVVFFTSPAGISSPLANSMPQSLLWPMLVLSVMAAVVASQALISGVFSLLSQAHALHFLPRILVLHTNPDERGQVYIPEVNFMLMFACIVLCIVFQKSSSLTGAYGISVTGTFIITTLLLWRVLRNVWNWSWLAAMAFIGPMLVIDILFWSANMVKILDSGWVPLLIAAITCLLMHAHFWGRERHQQLLAMEVEAGATATGAEMPSVGDPSSALNVAALLALLRAGRIVRTNTMAVFLTPRAYHVPRSLGVLAGDFGSLPGTIVLLRIETVEVPFVAEEERANFQALDAQCGLYSVVLYFGYAEPLSAARFNVRETLASIASEQVGRHPALAPLAMSAGPLLLTDTGVNGQAARRPGQAASVPYIFNKKHFAALPEHGRWTRFRILLYDVLSTSARSPVSTLGLLSHNVVEVSVVQFL